MRGFTFGVLAVAMGTGCFAQNGLTYQKPVEAVERMLDAPATPLASLSPDRKTLLVSQPATFPTIADVAQPRYRLAGLRFNPQTSGPSRAVYMVRLALQPVHGGPEQAITGLPATLKATNLTWSPDGRRIAFVQRADASLKPAAGSSGLQLWVIDVASARAHRVGTVLLNSVLGTPYRWMPSSNALVCTVLATGRGPAPKEERVPAGPNVQENLGRVAPGRTYEDMLKTPSDEAIFEYYATSQLSVVSVTGAAHTLSAKGLITSFSVSPDGEYVLVEKNHRPFSYTLPVSMFPLESSVIAVKGGEPKVLFDRPLVDNLPIAFDAEPTGPRRYEWRSDAPATLAWIESGDGGDPAAKVEVHDRVKMLAAPFTATPVTILESPMRVRGVTWGTEHLAMVTESRWSDRHLVMIAFDPSTASAKETAKTTTLYEGSSQDRYHSPGMPLEETNAAGKRVLQLTKDGEGIYFVAPGATRTGDKPFVAVMPVKGGEEKIIFRSEDPYYSAPAAVLDEEHVLVRRESKTESPNYWLASTHGAAMTPVTHFASPYEGINLPTHELVHYKRADGLDLTATLWLPAGYDKSKGPLPTLMEAYPAEFKSRATAGQVSGSQNRFPRWNWGSPVFFTQMGYAVLENAAIPIIGEGKAQPNDTYVEQLVAGAKAAIDYGASRGVVDPKRVAVMGHSYGAFMTANLLAHTNLFRAGIARSGAYNRTLTPYGFQAEERTYWQAPEVYYQMSPFSYADKIKTPILLIHGEADDNQGTFPIQSERFYEALKGQGATVRLVWLPLEAHGYEAHESLQHMLWEMGRWLDTYVKPETPVVAGK